MKSKEKHEIQSKNQTSKLNSFFIVFKNSYHQTITLFKTQTEFRTTKLILLFIFYKQLSPKK